MPEYTYTALDDQGEELMGTIKAGNKKQAIFLLRDQGLFPTKVMDSSGGEPKSKMSEEEFKKVYFAAEPKSMNPFTILKNLIRRKVLFGTIKKPDDLEQLRVSEEETNVEERDG